MSDARPPSPRSVGLRPLFIAAVTLVVLTTSILLVWALMRDRPRQMKADLAARGVSAVRMLAATTQVNLTVGNPENVRPLVEALWVDEDRVWVQIDGEDGLPVARGPGAEPGPWDGAPLHVLSDEGPGGVRVSEARTDAGAFLVIEAPVLAPRAGDSAEDALLGQAPPGAPLERVGAVKLVLTEARVEERLAADRRLAGIVTAGVVAIGLLLTISLSAIIVSPILELAAGARRIARGEMSVSVPDGRARELRELTQAFNQMSDALLERDVALSDNAQAKERQALALKERGAALEEALGALELKHQELRLSQDQLRQTNTELLHQSRLKSEFLASMSHELRTPLNSIIGYTECLLDGLDGPINEDQKESLSRVQRNGRHLLGLIGDILDLSKIESGKMELSVADLDMMAVATECVAVVRPLTRGKEVTVSLHALGKVPRVHADGARARQILLNLLSNAVKFTSEGAIDVTLSPDALGVAIEVRDTGQGIPTESLEEIFLEFRQLGGPGAPGTGLGLAITRRLVELMEGTIKVESRVGVGSTFTVWLPYMPAESSGRRTALRG